MKTYSRIRFRLHGSFWRRRPRPSAVLCATLLSPMGVALQVPVDSTTTVPGEDFGNEKVTRFTFGAGSGTYSRTIHDQTTRTYFLGYDDCGEPITDTVTYDADFRFKDTFKDYGGEIDVQTSDVFHIGVRGGWINDTMHFWGSSLEQATLDTLFANVQFRDSVTTNYYFNPYFAVERETVGFGAGFIYSSQGLWSDETVEYGDHDEGGILPTGHFRAGRLDKVYAKLSLWESVPIYSGGGKWVGGLGVRPAKPLELFGGFATGGPYSGSNLLLRANVDIGRHVTIGANYRTASDVDETFNPRFEESAASVALTYKFLHK